MTELLFKDIESLKTNLGRIAKANTLKPALFEGRTKAAYNGLLLDSLRLVNKIKANFINLTVLECELNDIQGVLHAYTTSPAWRLFSVRINTLIRNADTAGIYAELYKYQNSIYEALKPFGAQYNKEITDSIERAFMTDENQ